MHARPLVPLLLSSTLLLSCQDSDRSDAGDDAADSSQAPSQEPSADAEASEDPESAIPDEDEQDENESGATKDSPQDSPNEDPENPNPKGSKNKSGSPEDQGPLKGPAKLPKITGTCPSIKTGTLEFHPKGMASARKVQVWADPAAKGKKGPLVFYWHGTGQSPSEALTGLGRLIEKITGMGGVVAAPFHDPEAGTFPWFLVEGVGKKEPRMDDLLLSDEILACAIKEVGIDTTHIHTLGLSAGALQSTQMNYRRASYVASSVLYSGGLILDAPKSDEPRNKFSSMIFHGGPKDIVVIKFKESSERFLKAMLEADQMGFICDHGRGHSIPSGVLDSVLQFFMDHPYAKKSPYVSALPSGFPDYCKLGAPSQRAPSQP